MNGLMSTLPVMITWMLILHAGLCLTSPDLRDQRSLLSNHVNNANPEPHHSSELYFFPNNFDDLKEGQSKLVRVVFNDTMSIDVRSSDESIATVQQSLDQFMKNLSVPGEVHFLLTAVKIGKCELTWRLYSPRHNETVTGSVSVSVARRNDDLQKAFTVLVAVLVLMNNINMGCFIDLGTIKKVLEKPVAPAIGFFCQFLFMPLSSFFIGLIFFPANLTWRIGLFTLGCCPGGTGSNFWTLLFDGDVDLSITMTFISTLAALAMMPLWLFSLGRFLFYKDDIQIPYVNLLISLLMLALSLAIGIAIQRISPPVAKFLKKHLKTFTAIVIIIVIIGGIYVTSYIFQMLTFKTILAGLIVALGGYGFGAVTSIAFHLPPSQTIAVSIETALQNPGIAYVLIHMSLKHPDSDLATVPVFAQLFMTGIPLWLGFSLYFILTRLKVFRPLSQIQPNERTDHPPSSNVEMKSEYGDEPNDPTKTALMAPEVTHHPHPHPEIVILQPSKVDQ